MLQDRNSNGDKYYQYTISSTLSDNFNEKKASTDGIYTIETDSSNIT